ncbi:hypothetical protein Dimus_032242 [Dionaea muscipula]
MHILIVGNSSSRALGIGVITFKRHAVKGKAIEEDPQDPDDDDNDKDDDDDDFPLSHRWRKSTDQVVIETDSISTAHSIHIPANESVHESSLHESMADLPNIDYHEESTQNKEHETDKHQQKEDDMDEGSKEAGREREDSNPKDDAHMGTSRDVHGDEDENPKNDTYVGVSRDEMDVDDVTVDPKGDAPEGASRDVHVEDMIGEVGNNPQDDTLDGISRDDVNKHRLELVIHRGDPTAQVQTEKSDIHAHIEQVVKHILAGVEEQNLNNLDGVEEQNRGITELSEHLEFKIFIENQKENLMFLRLDEIRTHLRNLSTTISKTLLSISDILGSKMKSPSGRIRLASRSWKRG